MTAESQTHRWRAFAVLVVAYFMTIVDLTIVNVSLPTIGQALHFSETNLQWVVTAYGITFGGFLLLGGRAADLLGRRRILLIGLVLFTAASLGAGLSRSDGLLIAMRGLQGFGAAVATIGLITGGLVTRYIGWEYIFFLNVPVGAAALALAPRLVPESRLAVASRRFDPLGAVTVTGALLLLVYAISTTTQHGWGSTRTVTLLAVSAALLAAFFVVESRAAAPLMPLRIFRLRMVAVSNAAGFLLGGSFFTFIFIGTLYMQQVLHYSALEAGTAWLATSLTSVALAGLSQKLVTIISAGPVMAFGMALIGGGVLWATQVPVHGHFWGDLAGPFFVAGAGTAFAFVPVSIGGLTGVTEQEAGLASGLLNTTQQLGGSIGVAIASTVAATRFGTLLGQGKPDAVALTGGFRLALWVCGGIALLALPATATLLRRGRIAAGQVPVPEPEETLSGRS
jgi:MFS family permease